MEARAQPADASARWVFALLLAPLHLVLVSLTVGLRIEHLLLDALLVALFFIGPRTARLAAMALPLWLVGVLYEALPLFLPFRGGIHVDDLYLAERALFGVTRGGELLIPTEWIAAHLHPALDALTGLAYLAYLAEVFGVAAYLYVKRPERAAVLIWGFLFLNVAGMVTYVLYPAAPPWYVEQYGLGPAIMDAAPSAARAARFDALFGISVFESFYGRNVNVFGAMPSLHCAYPTLVFWVLRPLGRWPALGAAAFALWVSFSAVYLNHHYVLDVLAGWVYGTAVYAATRFALDALAARARPAPATTELEEARDAALR